MLHLLFEWEYPHWMIVAGAILVPSTNCSLSINFASTTSK